MTTYRTPEYYAKLEEWKRIQQEQIARLMEPAQRRLTEKEFGRVKNKWPEYREYDRCTCCGMELLHKQLTFCDDMCAKMYTAYPSQFGLYRKGLLYKRNNRTNV